MKEINNNNRDNNAGTGNSSDWERLDDIFDTLFE